MSGLFKSLCVWTLQIGLVAFSTPAWPLDLTVDLPLRAGRDPVLYYNKDKPPPAPAAPPEPSSPKPTHIDTVSQEAVPPLPFVKQAPPIKRPPSHQTQKNPKHTKKSGPNNKAKSPVHSKSDKHAGKVSVSKPVVAPSKPVVAPSKPVVVPSKPIIAPQKTTPRPVSKPPPASKHPPSGAKPAAKQPSSSSFM